MTSSSTNQKRNAVSSWSGYNHQGKVAIFLALHELRNLIENDKKYEDYKLKLENAEDADICDGDKVVSRHQVKAKKDGKYPSNYKNVLTDNYDTNGVCEDSRYLHTICEVIGFALPKGNFNFLFKYTKGKKPDYVENKNRVKLYQYPNGKVYCPLLDSDCHSPIDNFCKDEIKEILKQNNHSLQDDDDHIEETLFVIQDLLCTKISEAHLEGSGAYPDITFSEIYELVVSIDKREHQSIHRAKKRFNRYWNEYFQDDIDNPIANVILNLSNEEFKQFLIDLHPNKSIKGAIENFDIDGLLDESAFEDIFCEFFKIINPEKFDIANLNYQEEYSYRLSMINNTKAKVEDVIMRIINNREFLKASFETDYLINGNINVNVSNVPKYDENSKCLEPDYIRRVSDNDSIFSANLEFIDIDKTIKQLQGEGNA